MRSQIFLFLVHRGALRADFADSWLKDHEDLLDILMRRKRALAVKVIESHIEGTYQRVLAANREAEAAGSDGPAATQVVDDHLGLAWPTTQPVTTRVTGSSLLTRPNAGPGRPAST